MGIIHLLRKRWITEKKEADSSTLVAISVGMSDPDNKAVDVTNAYKVK
jgi:hypothetical protein